METKELTALDLAEVECEKAEEALNDQRYVCQQLTAAVEALEEYLEPSYERDTIKNELETCLEGAKNQLLYCETRLAAAENYLSFQKEKATNG